MSERPRVSVVVYGSILNPDDLGDLFADVFERVRPVKISGFERVFDQEASWRETDGTHRAVLNVKRNPESWFNGVLVTDLSRDEFKQFRERERGYRLVEIENDEIEPYDMETIASGDIELSSDEKLWSQHLVMTTVGKKVDSDILPIHDYVELCLDGAKNWGPNFVEDFLSTTAINTGNTLGEYIREEFQSSVL